MMLSTFNKSLYVHIIKRCLVIFETFDQSDEETYSINSKIHIRRQIQRPRQWQRQIHLEKKRAILESCELWDTDNNFDNHCELTIKSDTDWTAIPDICHFFTRTHLESWKFYTRKVRKFTTNLPRDKTA